MKRSRSSTGTVSSQGINNLRWPQRNDVTHVPGVMCYLCTRFVPSIAGALDILFVISFAGYNGVAPMRLLQTVASGVLGNAAFSGGISTAGLGMVLHFALSFLWAGLFLLAVWRAPVLLRRPLVSGIVYGVVVFLGMRLVVLPLSAFPFPVTFKPLASTLDLLSHMFLFGVPIAVAASKTLLAREPAFWR